MTPERWKQIEKLYHSALRREPSARADFLKEACTGDEALRQEVESLLAYQRPAESFTSTPAPEVAAQGLAEDHAQTVTEVVSKSKFLMLGRTVSHYRILEKLGEGGMGVVYKAQDLRLDRLVALKFLSSHVIPDEEETVRFIREAKAASALDHPNIGAIHEIADSEDGQMFIVMAYYGGETLKQKIEHGPLPIQEGVDIAVQMAQGLAKAHSQQIVHRDIKPGNVLVTQDGLVKIIDFGLAKLGGLTKITQTHTTMGTVAYMSPEQARGEEVDQPTDVWSLGVVLYEMLTGQLPFPGAHAETIIHAILTGRPKPLKQLRGDAPVEIERIIQQALEKEVKSRYASAAEALKDLTDFQASLNKPEITLSGLKLFREWLRQKQVFIPGIVLMLVLGSLLGWFFHRQTKVHWAREQALPEISQLIDEDKFSAAFALARQAEEYIPTDPQLVKLWPALSISVSIHTAPPAAEVYLKEYNTIDTAWTHLGQSPLENIRIPRGALRLKVDKRGFAKVETVFRTGFRGGENTISFKLDPEGSLPHGMVRALGGNSPITLNLPGLYHLEPVPLSDYWIDKYEVTNKEFKVFVDKGGYQKQEYWKHPFVKGRHEVSWSEAMADFRDTTGKPGPSIGNWEIIPKGRVIIQSAA